ncbi:MAG TPA: DUF5682 family protein [Pirellulales bacterium]|nr:DUF5682 family protein [Pirellulales bacterium]
MSHHVFGIRHHGPGCARSLRSALEVLQPDALLVEGPPDAEDVVLLAAHEGMRPPVALLVYPPDLPQKAVYYPFAEFSPEWQALQYALARKIPFRFMDLPQSLRLAEEEPAGAENEAATMEQPEAEQSEAAQPNAEQLDAEQPDVVPSAKGDAGAALLREDPIGLLAEAAGYSDRELWWEHQVEQRLDPAGLFEGLLEAMTALRASGIGLRQEDEPREAYMRQTIRTALKEGFERIAVVCGAWHAPALAQLGPAAPDAALLRGRKKIKVAATWIPWTNGRLSYRSGYGAGVASPGWYQHLWASPDRAAIRWAAQSARLLRSEDLDASSASVIETVRLADALAAMRGLPLPGLSELNDAVLAVLCGGDSTPLALIRQRMEIGHEMGSVPAETPSVPLARDLAAKQKRLRLKVSEAPVDVDLDLRQANDLSRSQLLHQLRLLGIDWGEPARTSSKQSGTFHENWRLAWQVEFAVKIIEANVWGNTVESAAAATARRAADDAANLATLTDLLDRTILAALPEAIEHVLGRIRSQAAQAADVQHLMQALPPLARIARYGNVRQVRGEELMPVIDGLFERAMVGLPGACSSLDDDAASQMLDSLQCIEACVALLDRADQRDEWQDLLGRLVQQGGVHGLVRGWCCRLLLERRVFDDDQLERHARLALSPALPAAQAGAWVEGLLRGNSLVLLHQDGLWTALDRWLHGLSGETFVELLPLLRRAFANFEPPARRAMGEKVKHLPTGTPARMKSAETGEADVDQRRARQVLPVLAHILGVPYDAS